MTADDVRARFEAWYVENAFNYVANPLGSRECGLQWKAWQAAHADLSAQQQVPIPMVLFCPMCGVQHIDKPETTMQRYHAADLGEPLTTWENPPHKSHLCAACGCIWRPADVPTVGVEAIETKGKADNFDPWKRMQGAHSVIETMDGQKFSVPVVQDASLAPALRPQAERVDEAGVAADVSRIVADAERMGYMVDTAVPLDTLRAVITALAQHGQQAPAQGGVTEALPKWANGAPMWEYIHTPSTGKELVARDEAEARIKEAALSAQQQGQGEAVPVLYANVHAFNAKNDGCVTVRKPDGFFTVPLYTAPPAQPAALSDEDKLLAEIEADPSSAAQQFPPEDDDEAIDRARVPKLPRGWDAALSFAIDTLDCEIEIRETPDDPGNRHMKHSRTVLQKLRESLAAPSAESDADGEVQP